MKGVSNFLALLIIVLIVIAVALVTNNFVFSFLAGQRPSGGDLVLAEFTWWYEVLDDNSLVIHVKGVITNIGSDPINVTSAVVLIGGKEYQLKIREIKNLKPNNINELIGSIKVDDLPESSLLTVVVRYCTPKECSKSVSNARLDAMAYVINKDVFGVTTVTVPKVVTTTAVQTITTTTTVTWTTTAPATTTITQTVTATSTATATQTVTTTTTAVTTTTITKPAWPVEFESCYGIDDYVYVWGSLDKKVNKDAEYIPYILKVYDCTVLGCNLVGVVPFEWGSPFNPSSSSSIQAKYGPIQVKPFHTVKVEVWSIDISTASLKDKIWEETVDTSVRCA